MKILAIVVSYFPDKDLLRKDIDAFKDDVDRVLIWENTPADQAAQFRLAADDKIQYCGKGINVGIPKALNYAWHYAQYYGYDYLLTMDQDSIWVDFPAFLQTVKSFGNKDAIFGPTPNDEGRGISENIHRVELLITSGMLVPVQVINKIGGWWEEFKIDSVDDEFCLHALSLGIKIYKIRDSKLIQQYGETRNVSLLWKHAVLTLYSPKRSFEMFRNVIILRRRYPQSRSIKNRLSFMLHDLKFLITEDHTLQRFYYITKGIISGLLFKSR